MGDMIPDDTWTLSPVSTTEDGLLQRVLSSPDGRTMLRISAHPDARPPAPIRFMAAAYTVSAVGGELVPETRWNDLSLQAWGRPEIVADAAGLRAFVAAIFAGQASQEADRALLAAVLAAWGHGRARSSWRGGEMQVSAEGDLRAGRYALVLKRHRGVRETVARGAIGIPPALRDALCARGGLLRASVPIQVVLPGEARSAHARLTHEVEVLEPLRRTLQAQAEGSGSDLGPLLAPTLKRLLSQLRA